MRALHAIGAGFPMGKPFSANPLRWGRRRPPIQPPSCRSISRTSSCLEQPQSAPQPDKPIEPILTNEPPEKSDNRTDPREDGVSEGASIAASPEPHARRSGTSRSRMRRTRSNPAEDLPPFELPLEWSMDSVRLYEPFDPMAGINFFHSRDIAKWIKASYGFTLDSTNPTQLPSHLTYDLFKSHNELALDRRLSSNTDIGAVDRRQCLQSLSAAHMVLAWQVENDVTPSEDFLALLKDIRNSAPKHWKIDGSISQEEWDKKYSKASCKPNLEDIVYPADPSAVLSTVKGARALLSDVKLAVETGIDHPAPKKATSRDFRRPVTIVSLSGVYSSMLAKNLVRLAATSAAADYIHIDAFALARLVGEYLGQDWTYSKGPISMLGFQAAEIRGNLSTNPDVPLPDEEDTSSEMGTAVVKITPNVMGGSSRDPMDHELDKINQSPMDYLLPSSGRWDNLKINVALKEILRACQVKANESRAPKKLVVHIDNYVELGMTLEGALLVSRLRDTIDKLWLEGQGIVLIGTSTCANPSEAYFDALREMSSHEHVIHRHNSPSSKPVLSENIRKFEYLVQNARNISHVVESLPGEPGQCVFNFGATVAAMKMKQDELVIPDKPLATTLLLDAGQGPVESAPHWSERELYSGILPPPTLYRLAHAVAWAHRAAGKTPSNTARWETVRRTIKLMYGTASPDSHRQYGDLSKSSNESSEDSIPDATNQSANGALGGSRTSNKDYTTHERKFLPCLLDKSALRVTFDDIHLPNETIDAMKILTSLSLQRPEAFSYGVLSRERIPGCLLYGPPGTGKTLLAKAVARECGANMLEVSAAHIMDSYVGQSEKNVQGLFTLAKKLSPVVIFLDEADSLLASRNNMKRRPYQHEVINQFLREWDGVSSTNAFIMVATNRPFDLDDAVLRRLPRRILVDLPLQHDRASILNILLRDETLHPSINTNDLARRTTMYSGSDLKNLCVAAAMAAVREESDVAARHTGPEPYVFPPRRILQSHHFDAALREIGSSVSDDMSSMQEIRKFDLMYGSGVPRKKKRAMGFGGIHETSETPEFRVRENLVA